MGTFFKLGAKLAYSIFQGSPGREALAADVDRWRRHYDLPDGEREAFTELLRTKPEFVWLMYYRLPRTRKHRRLLRILIGPSIPALYINTRDVGPGLFLQHAFSTIVTAEKIGRDCHINQNVTIGHGRGGKPTLGDNVTVRCGAVVIGPIHIGDGAEIGANAVVTKDVPPNCTVAGVPARIIKRDGRRVDEPLGGRRKPHIVGALV